MLEAFTLRIQQLGAMWARVLAQLGQGATEPEQLPTFLHLLEESRTAMQVQWVDGWVGGW